MSSPPLSGQAPPALDDRPLGIAPWFPLLLASGLVAAVVFLVVLPYESAGYRQGEVGLVAPVLRWSALITVLIGPIAATGVGVWAAAWAWLSRRRVSRRDSAFLVVAAAAAAVTIAFFFSPTWREASSFWLD